MSENDSQAGAVEADRRQVRILRLERPSDAELQRVGEALGIHESLRAQVQQPEVAPGALALPGQLLVRLGIPSWEEEAIDVHRLDLLVTERAVAVVEAEPLEEVDQSLERFRGLEPPASLGRLVTSFVAVTVETFEEVGAALREEMEAFHQGGAANSTTSMFQRVHQQLHPFLRELRSLQEGLEQLRAADQFVDQIASAELTAAHDRLRVLIQAMEDTRARTEQLATRAAADQADLGVESPEILESAINLGERRLHRVTLAHATTAFIGGLAVTFGAVAMGFTAGPWLEVMGQERAHLLGSLLFPIGFVILIIGKGELFTENFFVPVSGVLNKRGTVMDLLSLWGSTLLFNLLGSLVFALLISRGGVLSDGTRHFFQELAHEKVSGTLAGSFMKAVFAGWLMTMLTWLMLAARGQGSRLFIIWCIGFLIAGGHFNHVVISASEIFIGIGVGGPVSGGQWFVHNFLPALVGNLVGGVVFVTLLGSVQAHTLKQSEGQLREHVKQREHEGDRAAVRRH